MAKSKMVMEKMTYGEKLDILSVAIISHQFLVSDTLFKTIIDFFSSSPPRSFIWLLIFIGFWVTLVTRGNKTIPLKIKNNGLLIFNIN